MGLSKLTAQCQVCPYVDTCDHKRMEALGYLPLPKPNVEVQINLSPMVVDDLFDQLSRVVQAPKHILKGSYRNDI